MAEAENVTGAEGIPEPSFEERMKSLIEPVGEGKKPVVTDASLLRLAGLAAQPRNQTSEILAAFLRKGDDWFADGKVPEEEWPLLAGEIQAEIEKLRAKAAGAEPEIKKLERPKTTEEAVKVFLTEIFDLHERGLREGKSWEKTGELWSEFTTLQRWVEDIDPKWGEEFRNKALFEDSKKKDEEEKSIYSKLEGFLARQYPEGICLREKLSFLLEAMKRLHNRQIEIVRAEGGLEDLGVGKTGEAAAPILKVPLTNIRPIDWYILTHIDELFPELPSPETKIDLESAWNEWRKIGERPYGFYEFRKKGEKEEKRELENRKKRIEDIKEEETKKWLEENEERFKHRELVLILKENIDQKEGEKLMKNGIGKWAPLRWDFGKLEKIQEELDIESWKEEYSLETLFSSERVMAELRAAITKKVGKSNGIAGVRAESLAHSILTVSLTLDMWDRERWKQKGKQDARDLMWFDRKRIERFCDLRPAGPLDTVGCYWADEELMAKGFKPEVLSRLIPAERKIREEYLKKNKERERALSVVEADMPSTGTIIGDFFNSTVYKDYDYKKQEEVPKRLSGVSLKQIPWLDPKKFEEETYEGYFTYSLMFAATMESYIKKLEWKPEELKNRDFWVGLTDTTLRLAHFCPWLIAKGREEQAEKILKFRRILSRGMFWAGSYLAQPHPEKIFTAGTFSREDVYGKSFIGMKRAPGILDAIESAGYLNRESLEVLRREIYEFNFHLKGRA